MMFPYRVVMFALLIVHFFPITIWGQPQDCLVPCNEIVRGAGKDSIPAISDPEKLSANAAAWVDDQDIVLGVVRNGEACAYPLSILYWHEIVNDTVGGERSIISYCPLTGTGMHFDGELDNQSIDFGVSGFLWNSNLIMYNRSQPESLWSQMKAQAISGPHKEQKLTQLPITETTWKTWKTMHPKTKVQSNRTGFVRDYSRYPYGDYEKLHEPPYSWTMNMQKYLDSTLPHKLRVLGLIGQENTIVYPFDILADHQVVNHFFENEALLVVHDPESRMAMAYERVLEDGTMLTFSKYEKASIAPFALMDDQTGSTWNLMGEAIEGSLEGTQLNQRADGIVAFWFAWAAFHPDPLIYDGTSKVKQWKEYQIKE